jgi:hypothetical protein
MPTRTVAGRWAGDEGTAVASGTDRWPGPAVRIADGDADGVVPPCSQNGSDSLGAADLTGSAATPVPARSPLEAVVKVGSIAAPPTPAAAAWAAGSIHEGGSRNARPMGST